jgi:hypothetical protein
MSVGSSHTVSENDGISGKTSPSISTSHSEPPVTETFNTGDTLLIETLGVLNTERIKRNEHRAERRTKNEEETVSDDEENVVSSVLDRYKTARVSPSGPVGQPEKLAKTVGDYDTREKWTKFFVPGTLFTDEITEQGLMQIYDESIPNDIFILVKCKISPPLSLFTVNSLEHLRDRHNLSYKKVGTPGNYENVRVLVTDDFPADQDLKPTTWNLAYKTFLKWIHTISENKVSDAWNRRYDAMVADPEFKKYYAAYNDFDRDLRSRFLAKPFIIDPISHFWSSLLTNKKLAHGRGEERDKLGCVGNRTVNCFAPYPPSSFRTGEQSFQAICLRCRSKDGHRAYECTVTGATNNLAWKPNH